MLIASVALWVPAAAGASARAGTGAYFEVLETLADGQPDRALALLVEVEMQAAPTGIDEETERLGKGQLKLTRRLAVAAPESIVPIATLHERAYRTHLEEHRLRLAIRSRLHAVQLIELYLTSSEHPRAKSVGANLLTGLGGSLQEASMASVAVDLYRRALELDPGNRAALLGLSGLFERQGSYERALPYLEDLLRRDRDHREARLRLAINLLRLERRPEGEAELQRLRHDPQDDWILSLAYQELANLAARDGDHAGARRLLIEASERLPEDPSLAVQIAYLTDRIGGRPPDGELAAALKSDAQSSRPSPRSLYSRVCGQELQDLRVAIDVGSQQRLGMLSTALRGSSKSREASP